MSNLGQPNCGELLVPTTTDFHHLTSQLTNYCLCVITEVGRMANKLCKKKLNVDYEHTVDREIFVVKIIYVLNFALKILRRFRNVAHI